MQHEYALMTCNMWTDTNSFGEKKFANRSRSVIAMIRKYRPDIIGVQELTETMVPFLDELNDEYKMVGEPRHSHFGGNESCAILFRKDRFDLVNNETLWLSNTPVVKGSKVLGAQFPRIVTIAHLKDRLNGEAFTFANTHLEFASDIIRRKQVRILLRLLAQRLFGSFMFLSGDFNCTHDSDVLKPFDEEDFKDGISDDIGTTLRGKIVSMIARYKPIDHIFIPKRFKVLHTIKVEDEPDGLAPSDHYPVIIYISR